MKTNLPPPNYHQLQQSESGEFLLINRLIEHLAQPPFSQFDDGQTKDPLGEKGKRLPGIGDDCAVFPSSIVGKYLLASVDSFIEGRHFLFSISNPEEVGFKAVATSVSDIAAMGGNPRFVLINLHLTPNFEYSTVERIYRGIQECCSQFGVFVIGGNTSSATELSISTSIIGDIDGMPLLRSGATESDDFWISGTLGLSHLGLLLLKDKRDYSLSESVLKSAVLRYQRPEPRISLGQKLLALGATSAIDISDGIFQDAGHIALQSGVEIELELAALNQIGVSEQNLVELLSAGGDYELLFSISPKLRGSIEALNKELAPNSQLIRCGRATKVDGKGSVVLRTKDGIISSLELTRKYKLPSLGNDHFVKKLAV